MKYLLFFLFLSTVFPFNLNVSKSKTTVQQSPVPSAVPTVRPLPNLSSDLLVPGQYSFSFITKSGQEVRYLLYLPTRFNINNKLPLIVFFHGGGQLGNDPDLLKTAYLPEYLETEKDLPFIVASPNIASGEWEDYLGPIDEMVSKLLTSLPVNPHQLYLTGLSMGGIGAWKYALKYPNRFAAIVPVAGGYNRLEDGTPADLCKLKKIGVWVFNGDSDQGQTPFHSKDLVDKLNNCGGKAKFTLYKNADHFDTWHKAYQDPMLWKWLLKYKI